MDGLTCINHFIDPSARVRFLKKAYFLKKQYNVY